MEKFSTIHIFGDGQVQIIGKEKNGTVNSSELTTLQPLVDHVKTFLPATGVTLTNYHVIHIFKKMDVRYLGKQAEDKKANTSFSVKIDSVNQGILESFVSELVSKLPAPAQN